MRTFAADLTTHVMTIDIDTANALAICSSHWDYKDVFVVNFAETTATINGCDGTERRTGYVRAEFRTYNNEWTLLFISSARYGHSVFTYTGSKSAEYIGIAKDCYSKCGHLTHSELDYDDFLAW